MSRCIPIDATAITLGVDTHKDIHVGVALDGVGRHQGTLSVPANPAGYRKLVEWASGFGPLAHAGVEGTGSFGAGLARFLKARGIKVSEVIRPKRRDQYRFGKSDPIDAEAAARAVLAGTATGEPKDADGQVEMIRALRIARRSAVKARAQAVNQIKTMLTTAPEGLKSELCALSTARLVEKTSRLRPGANPSEVETATKFALRSVARRCQRLSEEISELDEQLDRLVAEAAPELLAVEGVGTDTAASLLIAAGDNPERLKDEAAFAHLCGAAPIPASSGKTIRHRLNRHGNRDAREQGAVRDRLMPREARRVHPSLRGQAHRRGQVQERDHPLPQEVHSPRDLPDPLVAVPTKTFDFSALTNIEASSV